MTSVVFADKLFKLSPVFTTCGVIDRNDAQPVTVKTIKNILSNLIHFFIFTNLPPNKFGIIFNNKV